MIERENIKIEIKMAKMDKDIEYIKKDMSEVKKSVSEFIKSADDKYAPMWIKKLMWSILIVLMSTSVFVIIEMFKH